MSFTSAARQPIQVIFLALHIFAKTLFLPFHDLALVILVVAKFRRSPLL